MDKKEREQLRKDKPGVWVPVEPGDRIIGTVIDIAAAWSDAQYDGKDPDSGFYPLLRIKVNEATGYTTPPEGPDVLAVHSFGKVLTARILDNEPTIGELVVITYEGTGEQASKKGWSPPELYRLELPERDPAKTASLVYGKLKGRRAPDPAPSPDPDVVAPERGK